MNVSSSWTVKYLFFLKKSPGTDACFTTRWTEPNSLHFLTAPSMLEEGVKSEGRVRVLLFSFLISLSVCWHIHCLGAEVS